MIGKWLPPAGGFLLITAALVVASFADYSWESWRPASCMPESCFCEQVRDATVRQPANTWSGLAFVLVGLLVLSIAQDDVISGPPERNANRMRRNLAYAGVYAVSLIVTGLGTVFFHASLTFVGQFFDVAGMYLLASFVLLYNLARLSKVGSPLFILLYLALNPILFYLLWEYPGARRYIFALLILAALGLEFAVRRESGTTDFRFLLAAVSFLAIAFIIWTLDVTRLLCDPESLFQGHAVWHILGALAGASLYLYYRSEQGPVLKK